MKIILLVVLAVIVGCTSVPIPNYIKADHPYTRKISGDYDKIMTAIESVLSQEGWPIQDQLNPAVFERHPGGEDQSKDVLFFTAIKQHPKFFYSTYTHLNIFVHAIAEGAEVEIRYGSLTPLPVKQLQGTRNDPLANRLLDKIEQELSE